MLRRSLFLFSLLITLVFLGARPALAGNDAAFVSQDVPTLLTAGETKTVSITMRNTGDTTWTPGLGYRLGTQSPQDNTLWTGSIRILLAPADSIKPGQEKTFTFDIKAPASQGFYSFQWRMVQEGVEWFGAFTTYGEIGVTATPPDGAGYISQDVPVTLNAGETRSVSVTMANYGFTTWTRAAGIKLGSENPRDNVTWGLTRVLLPAEPITFQATATFRFDIKAPSSPGFYNFQWRMVREGVAWFGSLSPNVLIEVKPVPEVILCLGVKVVFGDGVDDGPALQRCIDATPAGGTLQLPPGIYDIGTQVVINKTMTLRSSGTAGVTLNCEHLNCATLRALRSFNFNGSGFLAVRNASGVTIDHIVLDGSRAARIAQPPTRAAGECAQGNTRWGFNASIHNCTNCKFTYNVNRNALCGTGLEFFGHDATIASNVFRDNGQSSQANMGSDGLTVLYSDRGRITNNTFINNSGNALIVGGGRNALVASNTITQPGQLATAGLMLHRFGTSTPGDFTGAVVTQNRIDCGSARNCHFGIMLGPHPWDAAVQISGGTVHGNTVINARQGINVEGAGTIASPLTLYNNSVSGTPTSASFACGTRQTSPLNIYTPHSVVNRNGDTTPATNWLWHGCS